MVNTYYTPGAPIARFITADATRLNQEFAAIATAFDKFPSADEMNQGTRAYATATGAANSYSVTFPYPVTAYTAGLNVRVLFPVANTTSSTIAVNGLPPVQIRRFDGTNLANGDLRAGSINDITFNGTHFRLTSVHGSSEQTSVASATAAAASAVSAASSASQAAASALSASNSASTAIAASASAVSALAGVRFGLRNLLYNPVWWYSQRLGDIGVASVASVGANVYVRDRWKAGPSGLTFRVLDDAVLSITAGSLVQVVQGRNIIVSGGHTLSWVGTATATVNGVSRANGVSFDLPTYVNATVSFSGGTVRTPQLEYGLSKTNFEWRPTDLERPLCEQYYQKSYNDFVNPGTITDIGAAVIYAINAGNFSNGVIALRTKMRGTPAITFYSSSTGLSGKIKGEPGVDINGAANYIGDNSFFVYSPDTNLTTNWFYRFHWTADAEL